MKTICFAAICYMLTAALTFAQTVPSGMTYQGRLTDASNAPVPDGTGYEIEVRLWNSPTGGTTPLWGARYTGVSVKGGAFNLILSSPSTNAIAASTTDLKAAFGNISVHLGLTITKGANGTSLASPTEITPRQQIFSTPYAFRAEAATTAATVQNNGVLSAAIRDGEVNTADIALQAVQTGQLADQAVTSAKIADGTIRRTDISIETITPDRLSHDYAVFIDEKPTGTIGGHPSSTLWTRRTLNKITAKRGDSISLNDSIFTLSAGVYYIEGRAPAYNGVRHCVFVRKSGTTTNVLRGTSEHSAYNNQSHSFISGEISVTDPQESFELWHYIANVPAFGLGVETNIPGSPEIYSTLKITRIK